MNGVFCYTVKAITLARVITKLVLLLMIVISIGGCRKSITLPKGDPDNGGLFLPGNFEALVVADSTGQARHLAINGNGDIYVKLISSETGRAVVALRDTTNDGKADIRQHFGGSDTIRTHYGTGMTIHDDYLYFSSATQLFRTRLSSGKLVPDGETEIVFTDDHEHGIHWHITKPVSFDDKGNIYIPFGAPSNACQDLRETPNGAPGGVLVRNLISMAGYGSSMPRRSDLHRKTGRNLPREYEALLRWTGMQPTRTYMSSCMEETIFTVCSPIFLLHGKVRCYLPKNFFG
jgi:hypothetical protein